MTARYPLVRVGADISELPAGDTLIGASSYTLPIATTTVLGGVIADGTSITVDGTGKITANLASSTSQIKQLVKNNTGVTLLKGQAVYINGATGVNVTVALARANTEATSSKTLGLLETDILNGNTGYVITEGELANFDTSNAITEGDSVWLSPTTAGGLVYGLANKPVAPNHVVYLGVVSRKNVSNGVILVKVQNGYELDELHNVLITTPVNGNVLKYDSVTSLWKNDVISAVTSVSGTGTVSGLTLTGTVTDSGSLTLGGTLAVDYSSLTGTIPTWNQNTTGTAAGLSATLAIGSGGTGATTLAGANIPVTNVANTFTGTQTFSGTSTTLAAILTNAAETTTVSATAATGTIAYYTSSQSVLYYTSNASANWTLNITHSAGTMLNTAMAVGQTITVTHMVTNGTTAFYNNVVQIDGTVTGVTTKWQNIAPSTGDASAVDVYTYAVIKTGAATFTVLAAVSKFV